MDYAKEFAEAEKHHSNFPNYIKTLEIKMEQVSAAIELPEAQGVRKSLESYLNTLAVAKKGIEEGKTLEPGFKSEPCDCTPDCPNVCVRIHKESGINIDNTLTEIVYSVNNFVHSKKKLVKAYEAAEDTKTMSNPDDLPYG